LFVNQNGFVSFIENSVFHSLIILKKRETLIHNTENVESEYLAVFIRMVLLFQLKRFHCDNISAVLMENSFSRTLYLIWTCYINDSFHPYGRICETISVFLFIFLVLYMDGKWEKYNHLPEVYWKRWKIEHMHVNSYSNSITNGYLRLVVTKIFMVRKIYCPGQQTLQLNSKNILPNFKHVYICWERFEKHCW
jgi:hypothetical protein